jgi:hypothetical protein
MHISEDKNEPVEYIKTDILSRVSARSVDLIIVAALLELVPRAGFFAGIIYLLIADGLFGGRSIGKKLIGIKVVLIDSGKACGYKESIFRNLIFAIGLLLCGLLNEVPLLGGMFIIIVPVLILLFEGLILLGSENGMRVGDELAKTHVIEG